MVVQSISGSTHKELINVLRYAGGAGGFASVNQSKLEKEL
jgi:hypothetical protein